jgi:Bacterial Ig domain
MPGVAWAGPEGEADPSDAPGVSAPSQQDDPVGSAGDPSEGDTVDGGDPGGAGDSGDPDEGGSGDADVVGGGMNVGSSGGPITSTMPGSIGAKSKKKDDADPPKKRPTVMTKVLSLAPPQSQTTTQTNTKKTVADAGRRAGSQVPALNIAATDLDPQIKQSAGTLADIAPSTLTAPGLQKQVVARMTAVTKPLAQSPVSRLLPFVTLAPTADDKQPATKESPLMLGLMAAGREVDRKASVEDESLVRTVDSTQTGLMTTTSTTSLWSLFFRDTTKPVVSFSAPPAGPVSGTVTLSATASDNVGVTDVKFYVDNSITPLATLTASPYSTLWNTATVTDGAHTLKAVARDAAGNTTTSTPA